MSSKLTHIGAIVAMLVVAGATPAVLAKGTYYHSDRNDAYADDYNKTYNKGNKPMDTHQSLGTKHNSGGGTSWGRERYKDEGNYGYYRNETFNEDYSDYRRFHSSKKRY